MGAEVERPQLGQLDLGEPREGTAAGELGRGDDEVQPPELIRDLACRDLDVAPERHVHHVARGAPPGTGELTLDAAGDEHALVGSERAERDVGARRAEGARDRGARGALHAHDGGAATRQGRIGRRAARGGAG